MEPTSTAEWKQVESLLPEGWRELADDMGLVRKRPPHVGQKVLEISIALRLILHYVAQRGSMRMTTAAAATAKIVSISQPALFKWMYKIGSYLQALIARMVEPGRFASERWGGYVLVVADASTVQRPGAKGTTARLHYALHLSNLSPRFVRITDEKVGETARNFDPQPGELWILDRGYANPPSVQAIDQGGAAILVRHQRHTLPVYDARGRRVDVRKLVAQTPQRGRARQHGVRVHLPDGRKLRARLCWIWLPKPDAAQARAHAQRDGEKDPVELHMAEYIVVLTTAPSARLSAEQALEAYRARWQVELDFKRDKSIGGLDMLPSLIPRTIHSWLCAKVLLALIVKRLAAQSVAIPPCGLCDALIPVTPQVRARDGAGAMVRDGVHLETSSRCVGIHQAA